MQIFLEFLETQFQNVTILLEKIYLSQLTACIIARVCSSNFFTIIMKHPVGDVPTYKMHNVGTVPTYNTHNIGTELSYATLKLELD